MTTSPNRAACPCCAAATPHAFVPVQLIVDGGIRPLDEDAAAEMALAAAELPPILVDLATSTVVDGRTRLEAHRRAASALVPVRFTSVHDEVERLLAGLDANRCHGRRPRVREVSALICQIIRIDPTRSNGFIHRATGAAKSTVQAQRERVLAERLSVATTGEGVQIGPPERSAGVQIEPPERSAGVQSEPRSGRATRRRAPGLVGRATLVMRQVVQRTVTAAFAGLRRWLGA